MRRLWVYKTIWGLEVGDLIKTSWSGHYEICDLSASSYVHWFVGVLIISSVPTISIMGVQPGGDFNARGEPDGWINEVRFQDGRYLTPHGEIFVTKPKKRRPMQIDMFTPALEEAQPYQFCEGIDYTIHRGVWHCKKHGDFNAEPISKYGPAFCPQCELPAEQIMLHSDPDRGTYSIYLARG